MTPSLAKQLATPDGHVGSLIPIGWTSSPNYFLLSSPNFFIFSCSFIATIIHFHAVSANHKLYDYFLVENLINYLNFHNILL